MIKIKQSVFLIFSALFFTLFFSACINYYDESIPKREYDFSDETGINFSVEITPAVSKNSGRIVIKTSGETDYLYSCDHGKSYRKIRKGEAVIHRTNPESYSFCLMETPEKITDIYTVYAGLEADIFQISASVKSSSEKILNDGSITVFIDNFIPNEIYEISLDGGESRQEFNENPVRFGSLAQGIYPVTVRLKSNSEAVSPILNAPVVHAEVSGAGYINVASVMQTPELPTGCEITSLTMLLNYLGFDADKLTLADEFLPKGEYRKADFHKVFVGDPRNRNAYGCTAPVIVEAAENYLKTQTRGSDFTVKDISGCTADLLYSAVDNGVPAVVWASINMGEIIPDFVSWTDEETGETVSWYGGEHCLLLTGYDKKSGLVYVNDPLRGAVTYDMKIFEKRFDEMQRNAVIIIEN